METIFQKVYKLHIAGKSQQAIATELGISQPTVCRIIKEAKRDLDRNDRCPCCGYRPSRKRT